jgi:hypothetical protein
MGRCRGALLHDACWFNDPPSARNPAWLDAPRPLFAGHRGDGYWCRVRCPAGTARTHRAGCRTALQRLGVLGGVEGRDDPSWCRARSCRGRRSRAQPVREGDGVHSWHPLATGRRGLRALPRSRGETRGVDGALRRLADRPYGPWCGGIPPVSRRGQQALPWETAPLRADALSHARGVRSFPLHGLPRTIQHRSRFLEQPQHI